MTDRSARLLRRRTTDRVIGGVAGGLGDYFNVDPLLIRIGFVGLMIFGGAGLVLYVLAWLLLPAEGQDASAVEGFVRRLGITPRGLLWAAVVVLVILFLQAAGTPGGYFSFGYPGPIEGPVWLAVAVVGVGIWLLRRREPTATAPTTVIAAPRAPAVPRPRSPLGWYVFAATLITAGLLAIVSQVAHVKVAPGQFFGAALTVIGIGLVIGAWWGRARILVLLALLLLPIAVPASFITAPIEGGLGDLRYTPGSAAELRTDYRLIGGRLVLDLTGIHRQTTRIHIAASVAVGQLVVLLPENASAELETQVGAGGTLVFDARQVGTSLQDRYVRHETGGASYLLELEAGIGEIRVITQSESN